MSDAKGQTPLSQDDQEAILEVANRVLKVAAQLSQEMRPDHIGGALMIAAARYCAFAAHRTAGEEFDRQAVEALLSKRFDRILQSHLDDIAEDAKPSK